MGRHGGRLQIRFTCPRTVIGPWRPPSWVCSRLRTSRSPPWAAEAQRRDKGMESPPSSGKRKKVDSVVTSMPAGSTGGRTLQRPAWLSGGIGSYSMGRGGGHGQRGWNPNWRGSSRSRSRSRYGRRGRQWHWWSEPSVVGPIYQSYYPTKWKYRFLMFFFYLP